MNTVKRLEPHKEEFLGWMEASNDLADEMPDGAWFVFLEQSAEHFFKEYRIKGVDANDAVHWYLHEREET